MATPNVDSVLSDIQHLTTDERLRVLEELQASQQVSRSIQYALIVAERARQQATSEETENALARFKELAGQISDAWQDDVSAVDAVREQRRDL